MINIEYWLSWFVDDLHNIELNRISDQTYNNNNELNWGMWNNFFKGCCLDKLV